MSKISEHRQGLIYVLICQLMWGLLPIYWRSLQPIESWQIILYRIFTMFVYSYIAARFIYSKEEIWGPYKERSIRVKYTIAGIILAANWSIYIWAVSTGRLIQSAIGYYIEPIVICAFGIVIFKEKLTKYSAAAIVFAAVAIIIILVHYRELPAVALSLSLTWAVYSAIKKASEIRPVIALVYETMPLAIVSFFVIIYTESKGIGSISLHATRQYVTMWMSGLLTLIPVSLFAYAAKKTSLLVIGLVQYLSPTLMLLIGIFVFHEPADKVQLLAFLIIWIGLIIFTYGEFKEERIDADEQNS